MNSNNTIEKKIKEFDAHYICEWRWKREAPNKPSAADFLRQSLHDIRRQALEEAIECRPKEMSMEVANEMKYDVGAGYVLGYNRAISDYQFNIKAKL